VTLSVYAFRGRRAISKVIEIFRQHNALGINGAKTVEELVTIVGPIFSAVIAAQAAASLAVITWGLVIILFLIFEPRGLAHRWGDD